MLKKIIIPNLVLLNIFLIYHYDAQACVCVNRNSVLEEFEWATHVLTAKVVSVKKTEEGVMRYAYEAGTPLTVVGKVNGVESTTMTVGKVYKGNLIPGGQIEFIQGGGANCIYTFSDENIGEEFLLYLDDSSPIFTLYTCGRSNIMKWAGDDILYLDNIENVKGKTRISGRLKSLVDGSPNLNGLKIRVRRGNKIWEVYTNANGVYEIYDLPDGEYSIEPDLPSGWQIDPISIEMSSSIIPDKYVRTDSKIRIKEITVVLEKRKHVSLDLLIIPDNAIRGYVLSPSGQPMEGVCLDVQFLDDPERWSWWQSNCTNKNGEFIIDEIPEGKYILVANKRGEITHSTPFRTLYFPGVSDREKAKVFSITPGTFINYIEFRIQEFDNE